MGLKTRKTADILIPQTRSTKPCRYKTEYQLPTRVRRATFKPMNKLWMTIALLLSLPAHALVFESRDCGAESTLQVDSAKLPAVLQTMSDQLGFVLKFNGDPNRIVSGRWEGTAEASIRNIVGSESLVLVTEENKACERGFSISRVVVLPEGEAGPTKQQSHVSPEWQRYLKAHGLEDQMHRYQQHQSESKAAP